MQKLIVSLDGVVIKEVTLAKDRTTLGRRPYNDIVIDNLAISGEHAALHMVGDDVYLEDLNSTNGSFVNGRRVKKQALANNDVIEVGKYKIRYLLSDSPTPGARPVAAPPRPMTEPIPLTTDPTVHSSLGTKPKVAIMRNLSGENAGRETPLQKVVTTIGKPGREVAAITRRQQGYVVAPISGITHLNGQPLGAGAIALHDGDVLDVGAVKLQFVAS